MNLSNCRLESDAPEKALQNGHGKKWRIGMTRLPGGIPERHVAHGRHVATVEVLPAELSLNLKGIEERLWSPVAMRNFEPHLKMVPKMLLEC